MTTDLSHSRDIGRFDELAEEFAERFRRGERPSLEEYIDRLPGMADDIREMFPALVEVERAEVEARAQGLPAPPEAIPRPSRIGDYRIIREVGRGGMGIVYEAEQLSLGRRVALKVLPSHIAANRKSLERFRREAKAAARLHHTNIVPVFEVGRDGDTAFYTMQFIHGQGLDQLIDELTRIRESDRRTEAGRTDGVEAAESSGPPLIRIAESLLTGRPSTNDCERRSDDPVDDTGDRDGIAHATQTPALLPGRTEISGVDSSGLRSPYFRSVAMIGRQAAQGLAFAHARGVVHRDVKPSNLLLDAAGVVWITDFGLAKAQSEDDGLTATGDVLGTLRYMAPERFRGDGGARADVYALGLTLYELLTLRPAHRSSDRLRLIEQIKSTEPIRPRTLDGRIPRDLETIILKAIEKEPDRRYQTAEALAEDLRRFLSDEPIRARQAGNAERCWRWARRNPATAGLGGALVATLIIMVVGFATAAAHFQTLAAKATTEGALLERQLYINRINLALHEADTDIMHAEDLLALCPPAHQGWEWQFLHRYCHLEERTLECGPTSVNAVAFSPDGTRVVTGVGKHYSSARREDVAGLVLWDARTGDVVKRFDGLSGSVNAVAFSPDGTRIVAACGMYKPNAARFTIWDVAAKRLVFDCSVKGMSGLSVALSPDGRMLAAGLGRYSETTPGRLILWDVETGGQLADLSSLPGGVNAVAFSPDGTLVAAACSGTVELWDVGPAARSGEPAKRRELRGAKGWIYAVAFSPDGARVTAGGWDKTIRLWDISTGLPAQSINVGAVVYSLAFSPDGSQVAVTRNSTIALWDYANGRLERFYRGHRDDASAVAFSPDGRRLVSGSLDGTAKLWEINTSAPAEVPTRQAWVNRLLLTRDGARLYSTSSDHSLVVWNPATWQRIHSLTLPNWGEDLALSPDGARLATVDVGRISIWDTATWRELYCWGIMNHHSKCVAISDDGSRLAYGTKGVISESSPRGVVQICDLITGRELLRFTGHNVGVYDVAFAPNGRVIASVGGTTSQGIGEVKLWEIDTGRVIQELRGHEGTVRAVAFSPDGSCLATAGHDGTARAWNPGTGMPIWIARIGTDVLCLAYSPDGSRIATGDAKKGVKILDAATGDVLINLPGSSSRPLCLTFSPDGRRLLSGTIDGMICVWDADPSVPSRDGGRRLGAIPPDDRTIGRRNLK